MEEKDLPSKEESRLINLILSNGARFYVDHAHPEYSSPETTNPRDLVIWDKAGERILNLSRTRAEAVSPPEQRILIYKDNSDRKGNSYGTHENYLMDRKVPFARIVQYLMPFFASRQIYTGSGKVGAENNTEHCDYQISQRADFLETEVGLETMHSRPIINTRDEPHADPEKYRRLHVIVGDANMSEISNYLKCGTMAIVLSMVEDDFLDRDFSLEGPVGVDPRPSGRGSDAARARAGLGHQAATPRELHREAPARVERLAGADDRPPVPRHPSRPGPLRQAGGG